MPNFSSFVESARRFKVALIGLLVGSLTLVVSQVISVPGDYSFEQSASSQINADSTLVELPGSRDSQLRLPNLSDESKLVPLLINLHGYTGTGTSQSNYTFLEQAAVDADIAYIAPTGIKDNAGSTFWNANSACCNFNLRKVDDVAFIDSLIKKSLAAANIDPKKIYLFGHSNGAFMSYAFLCSGKRNVAAIAGIAGAMNTDPLKCKSEPNNILHIHGEKDGTILYNGGSLFGNPYTSVESTIEQWSNINVCRMGRESDLDLLASLPGVDAVKVSYRCARGGLELWRMPEGEHSPVLDLAFAQKVLVWLTSFELEQ